ncbi:hypothetical protein CPB85DRAFT_1559553 [Mucidula mucida]|nr:hypothetical protein CPB85DRAFT_1559553 [Mucidula mucida]
MGHSCSVFNVSKGVTVGSYEGFRDIFLSGSEAGDIVKLISSTGVTFPKDPVEDQPYKEARKCKPSKTGLCDLPTELHNAIFAELDKPVDVFAFSLTASHFWRIGVCHFKVLYTNYFRRAKDWSRARLICLGDASGCPDGLVSEELVEELEDAYFDLFGEEDVGIYSLLCQFSERDYKVKWPMAWDFRERCALSKLNPLVRKKSGDAYGWEDDTYLPLYKYDFSAWIKLCDLPRGHNLERPCVLRNLSKKVYVRDDALLLETEDTTEDEDGAEAAEGAEDAEEDEAESRDVQPYYMSFGSLLILRIAWSTDLSLGTANDDDLCRGIWAGDRFDIVSLGVVEKEEGWTDVSTAERAQLIQIWKAVFGRQWKAEVRKSGL